jgi:acyl-CoA thioester hydrolase
MTETILTFRGAVYPWHCDHMGHMNVMWYVGRFDEATWCLFHHLGLTRAYLRDEGRGMVAVQQNITYKAELLAGDVIQVSSRLLEVKEKALRFEHRMAPVCADEGGVVAICELVGVHIDTTVRKSVPLPESVRTCAEALVARAVHR